MEGDSKLPVDMFNNMLYHLVGSWNLLYGKDFKGAIGLIKSSSTISSWKPIKSLIELLTKLSIRNGGVESIKDNRLEDLFHSCDPSKKTCINH